MIITKNNTIMKKLLLLLVMMMPMVASADTWNGVSSDKSWYDANATEIYITNAAQLKGLADLVTNDNITFEGKTIYLQNDIDLANYQWEPIGYGLANDRPFKGVFDGQNHAVINLYIDNSQLNKLPSEYVGFFGQLNSGEIRNLGLKGVVDVKKTFNSTGFIGGVVAYASGESNLSNIRSSIIINSRVSLSSTYIGNVAGWAHNMSKIYSEGEIHFYDYSYFSSQSYYGGIVGQVQQLSECFSNVRVVIPSDGPTGWSGGNIGGIVGEATSISDAIFTGRFEVYEKNKNRATLSGCISARATSLTNIVCAPSYYYCNTEKNIYFKGLVVPGINEPTANNVYYQNTYAQGTSVIGIGVSEEYLKSGEPLDGFSTSVWKFKSGEYPILKAFYDGDDEIDADGRIDGVYYELDSQSKTATVVSGSIKYSGDVVIKELIKSGGEKYVVNTIGDYAFNNCVGLTVISIPESVSSIGTNAFYGCSGLISVHITDLEAWCKITYTTSYKSAENSNPLKYAHHLFLNDKEIQDLVIPNNVASIGRNAFHGCRGLKSVTIPSGVTTIGDYAFYGCKSLISASIAEGVTSIGDYAFCWCDSLTSITLPESVSSLGKGALARCVSLISVTIPNSITSIKDETFLGSALQSISLPQSITSIGKSAFERCSLASVTIPNSVAVIGENAFYNNNKLTSATIGSGIKTINKSAFASCAALIDIYCYAKDVPSTNSTVFNNSNPANITLHVPAASVGAYEAQTPWSSFKEVVSLPYIIYMVDGEVYKQDLVMIGTSIPPIEEPKKEGHTFSGWSEIPEIMPDHDITVTGSFTINKYKLTYQVDGEEYKTYDVEYGTAITPETAPTKEGHTFSGWSWVPSKMPAEDVTVTGTFTINKYKLTYMVNGEKYKSYDVEYGQSITPEGEPTKEGYTFSGWSWIPSKMPAEDVTVTGTFTANHYKLIYMVDGAVYKSIDVACDDPITPEAEPTKEGYTFSGWSYIPKKMPAEDVTVTGTFSINSYKLTYMIDNEVYKETMYEYGATITPEPQPEGDYQTFEWTDLPQTMPAHDVTVYATYTSGIAEIVMMQGVLRIYGPDGKPRTELQKGLNIVRMSDGTTKKIVVK